MAFSRDGERLVAVGGEWPEQAVVVVEWRTYAPKVLRRQPLGRQRVLAIACDPYSDAFLLVGINRVERWRPLALRKEAFRKQLGWSPPARMRAPRPAHNPVSVCLCSDLRGIVVIV